MEGIIGTMWQVSSMAVKANHRRHHDRLDQHWRVVHTLLMTAVMVLIAKLSMMALFCESLRLQPLPHILLENWLQLGQVVMQRCLFGQLRRPFHLQLESSSKRCLQPDATEHHL